MEKKQTREVDKKVFSFLQLTFPTVMIVGLAMLTPEAWWALIVLAVYQMLLIKQFLDKYYEF